MPQNARCVVAVILMGLACGVDTAGGQQAGNEPAVRSFAAVRAAVAQAEGVGGQEIRLHWIAPDPSVTSRPGGLEVQVRSRQRVSGLLRKERNPELAEGKLVVVSVGRNGQELDWRIVTDPTLIRGEAADPKGNLTRQDFRQREADLLVVVPDLPEIARLSLYQPRWNGREFVLDLIAALELP